MYPALFATSSPASLVLLLLSFLFIFGRPDRFLSYSTGNIPPPLNISVLVQLLLLCLSLLLKLFLLFHFLFLLFHFLSFLLFYLSTLKCRILRFFFLTVTCTNYKFLIREVALSDSYANDS